MLLNLNNVKLDVGSGQSARPKKYIANYVGATIGRPRSEGVRLKIAPTK